MQAPSLPLLSPRYATVAGADMGGVEAEARIWEAAASRPAGLLSVAECAFHPHHQHHRWIEPGTGLTKIRNFVFASTGFDLRLTTI